jgi:hypothetical protein
MSYGAIADDSIFQVNTTTCLILTPTPVCLNNAIVNSHCIRINTSAIATVIIIPFYSAAINNR